MNRHLVASAGRALLLTAVLFLPAPMALANAGGYGGSGSGDWSRDADELDQAWELIEMGSFGSAIWQLKRLIADSPDNADAHNLLAFSYRSLRKYDLAAEHYERALEIDPDHAGAHVYQGILFLETGRPEQARQNLERLREICGRGCSEYQDLRDAIQRTAGGG